MLIVSVINLVIKRLLIELNLCLDKAKSIPLRRVTLVVGLNFLAIDFDDIFIFFKIIFDD